MEESSVILTIFGVILWASTIIAILSHFRISTIIDRTEGNQKKIEALENSIVQLCGVLKTMNDASIAQSKVITALPELSRQQIEQKIEEVFGEKAN